MRTLLLCLFPVATATLADGLPSASYYVGQYTVIGRADGQRIDDRVQLTQQGDGIAVASCHLGDGMLQPSRDEGPFLDGVIGKMKLICQSFNTWDNYALLACTDEAGVKLVLWPDEDSSPGPLQCD